MTDTQTMIDQVPQPQQQPQQQVQQPERPPEQMNGAQAAPAVFDGKILLRKKIMANGTMVDEITFREPTGGDIEQAGVPVGLDFRLDSAAMTLMMAHLARVPPSAIRMMHAKDWSNAAFRLLNFFLPDAR